MASNSRSEMPAAAPPRRPGLAQPLLDQAQVAGQRLDVRQHEGGRVVDLVRHAGGQKADRGQLLGLQAADLALALVGGVADVEHGPPPRQRIGAHGEGPPAVATEPDRRWRRWRWPPAPPPAAPPATRRRRAARRWRWRSPAHRRGPPGRRRPRTRRTSRGGRRSPSPARPMMTSPAPPAVRDSARRSRSRAPRRFVSASAVDPPCQFPGCPPSEPQGLRRRQRGARGIIDEEYARHAGLSAVDWSGGVPGGRRRARGNRRIRTGGGARACRRPR